MCAQSIISYPEYRFEDFVEDFYATRSAYGYVGLSEDNRASVDVLPLLPERGDSQEQHLKRGIAVEFTNDHFISNLDAYQNGPYITQDDYGCVPTSFLLRGLYEVVAMRGFDLSRPRPTVAEVLRRATANLR